MVKKYTKQIMGTEARTKLLEGARMVYEPVVATLGARGRNIVVSKYHDLQILHDGVKTSESINPENPYYYAGAQIIKEAGRKQLSTVGDGTTCAILLSYSIAKEALKIVESGINPMGIRDALYKGSRLLIEEIEKHAKPVKTRKQKIEVATISAGENELGEIIGDTWHKAGVDGVVTVSDDPSPETYVEHEEGLQIDSGYVSDYFVTNPSNMTATLTNTKVLVTDHKLSDIYAFAPLLKALIEKQGVRNLLIIASGIEGSVLATLVQNKMQGKFNSIAIKAPSFRQKEYLQDIATITGGTYISKSAYPDLKTVKFDDIGSAESVTSSRDATVIVGGGGDSASVNARIQAIKQQMDEEDNEFNREKLRERLGKLQGGIYVIHVGAQTEVESREKKERAEDAVLATKAAISSGIVGGGETIYLAIRDVLTPESEAEEYAYRILKNALYAPFNKLMENAGFDPGEMRAKLLKPDMMGFDVTDGKMKEMIKSGIIDPSAVPINALKNAVSTSTAIICSDGIITEEEMPDVSDKKS